MAKSLTSEELHLMDKVVYRNYSEGSIGDEAGFPDERVRRVQEGEIERAEYMLRSTNVAYALGSVSCKDGTVTVRPRPHFSSWQELYQSWHIADQAADLMKEEA